MRRAFVGFSSPIGYRHHGLATVTKNDVNGMPPNPILYASTALLVLYDEIWFACESLCPQSMRKLPYVRFLDQHLKMLDLVNQNFDQEISTLYAPYKTEDRFRQNGISDFNHRSFCKTYFNFELDDHRGCLNFFGKTILPKIGKLSLIIDLWLISKFKEKSFEIVLNPITAQALYRNDGPERFDSVEHTLKEMELSEEIVTLRNTLDILGIDGPYHPVIEELRNDEYIINFRNWLSENVDSLYNKRMPEIVAEVNIVVDAFNQRSRVKHLERASLSRALVSISKGTILSVIPGSSIIVAIADELKKMHHREEEGWKSFIGHARGQVATIT